MSSLPKDYVVEPGQSYTFELFRPEDAEGVVHLFKTVYGEGYPISTFIDPKRLIEENAAGRSISCVARTPKGDIVGHNALFCFAPYSKTYEGGAGLVHPSYRGGAGIFTGLGLFCEKVAAPQFGVEAIFGEPVCNHVFAQRAMVTAGYITHTLEVDLMPAAAYDTEKSALGRVSTLLGFKTLHPNPHGVFVPQVYQEPFDYLYSALDDKRQIRISASEQPPGIHSDLTTHVFDFAQVARIVVNQVGRDFMSLLEQEEKRLSDRKVVVYQIWLNLAWPWINDVVLMLQARNYFLGGLLPRWYDTDGMLMQKVTERPNWEGINLYFDRAKKILEWVRADWERTVT
ncbi:MAG: hypothetical protein C0407_01270 [Desulfobacca sp.]|nr:hypothetical protein [Desulfobacca sp.]